MKARLGRNAAKCRSYLPWVLGSFLSATPAVAVESMVVQQVPASPAIVSEAKVSTNYQLLAEANRKGYFQDSPYLSRRLSQETGGIASGLRRHPATPPQPVPHISRKQEAVTQSEAPVEGPRNLATAPFDSVPVAEAATVTPVAVEEPPALAVAPPSPQPVTEAAAIPAEEPQESAVPETAPPEKMPWEVSPAAISTPVPEEKAEVVAEVVVNRPEPVEQIVAETPKKPASKRSKSIKKITPDNKRVSLTAMPAAEAVKSTKKESKTAAVVPPKKKTSVLIPQIAPEPQPIPTQAPEPAPVAEIEAQQPLAELPQPEAQPEVIANEKEEVARQIEENLRKALARRAELLKQHKEEKQKAAKPEVAIKEKPEARSAEENTPPSDEKTQSKKSAKKAWRLDELPPEMAQERQEELPPPAETRKKEEGSAGSRALNKISEAFTSLRSSILPEEELPAKVQPQITGKKKQKVKLSPAKAPENPQAEKLVRALPEALPAPRGEDESQETTKVIVPEFEPTPPLRQENNKKEEISQSFSAAEAALLQSAASEEIEDEAPATAVSPNQEMQEMPEAIEKPRAATKTKPVSSTATEVLPKKLPFAKAGEYQPVAVKRQNRLQKTSTTTKLAQTLKANPKKEPSIAKQDAVAHMQLPKPVRKLAEQLRTEAQLRQELANTHSKEPKNQPSAAKKKNTAAMPLEENITSLADAKPMPLAAPPSSSATPPTEAATLLMPKEKEAEHTEAPSSGGSLTLLEELQRVVVEFATEPVEEAPKKEKKKSQSGAAMLKPISHTGTAVLKKDGVSATVQNLAAQFVVKRQDEAPNVSLIMDRVPDTEEEKITKAEDALLEKARKSEIKQHPDTHSDRSPVQEIAAKELMPHEMLELPKQAEEPIVQPEVIIADKGSEVASVFPVKVTKVTKFIGGGSPVVAEQPKPVEPASLPPTPVAATPVPPVVAEPVIESVAPKLSDESRKTLEGLPSGIGNIPLEEPKEPLSLAHSSTPDMEVKEGKVGMHEARGVKIEVKEPGVDVTRYMEEAYNAVLKEDLATAMNRYQLVLEAQPQNNEAKFGLATTYHRMGELVMARTLYAEVIAAEPENLEALNNLLVLVSQESPKEALAELQKLERRNPNFSPIPAQMAALYSQMREFNKAVESIQRAIRIDPNNLAYRYNAAVLMDRAGRREEAIALYVELKRSYEKGLDVPADMAAIQERLTFLLSNRG